MDYRKEFPIFKEDLHHYFDSGATSQKPNKVIKSVREYYENYNGNPGRGSHMLAIKSEEIVNEARRKIQKFINAKETDEIIFTKNTTESINIIAYSYGLNFINEGDEIILCVSNHHANIVPWQFLSKTKNVILKYVYLDENGQFDMNDFNSKLTSKTKLVSLSYVVNVTGIIQPVEEIIKLAHEKGALVVVDAAQSILHFEHDVQKLDADFLVFSGHKLFSEMGIGILYGKKELLNTMPPFLYGGNMIEFVTEEDSTFAQLPNKFEAGTLNVGGIVSLKSAIEYIEEIGYKKIYDIEKKLDKKILLQLNKMDFIETYFTENEKRVGIIAFNVIGVHSHDVSFILDSYGVEVRSGHHCAQPLMNYLKIPSCCRISFGIYNNDEDCEKLIKALFKVKEIFGL